MVFPNGALGLSKTLDLGAQILRTSCGPLARFHAERLLCQILNLTRAQLYLHSDLSLNGLELIHFKRSLERRLRQEPLQYIVGETEFMSLPFRVNPSVMIPRPETEVLVETVLDECRQRFSQQDSLRILDVGTGSGCIAISLAKYLAEARVTAWDISRQALHVAMQNAALNHVSDRIEFQNIDLFDSQAVGCVARTYDVIVSNPPYVADKDFADLPAEVREFEPTIALQAGSDGLRFFRQLIHVAPGFSHRQTFFAVEVGFGQAPAVAELFLNNGFGMTATHEDLTGIERVVSGQW